MTLLYFGIILATIVGMEAFSWFFHKYMLHGPLWFLHRSHHSPRHGWFEWNDLVSVAYALPAVLGIYHGLQNNMAWLVCIGAGITIYGILYFTLHDVIIHRRVKFKYHFTNPYLLRLIRAHKIHHKHLRKNGSCAFGFLYASGKYQPKATDMG